MMCCGRRPGNSQPRVSASPELCTFLGKSLCLCGCRPLPGSVVTTVNPQKQKGVERAPLADRKIAIMSLSADQGRLKV